MKGGRSGVERRRGVSGLKPARGGRRETPGLEVLKESRSTHQRGRMGTSVRNTHLVRAVGDDQIQRALARGANLLARVDPVPGDERDRGARVKPRARCVLRGPKRRLARAERARALTSGLAAAPRALRRALFVAAAFKALVALAPQRPHLLRLSLSFYASAIGELDFALRFLFDLHLAARLALRVGLLPRVFAFPLFRAVPYERTSGWS